MTSHQGSLLSNRNWIWRPVTLSLFNLPLIIHLLLRSRHYQFSLKLERNHLPSGVLQLCHSLKQSSVFRKSPIKHFDHILPEPASPGCKKSLQNSTNHISEYMFQHAFWHLFNFTCTLNEECCNRRRQLFDHLALVRPPTNTKGECILVVSHCWLFNIQQRTQCNSGHKEPGTPGKISAL